MQKKINVSTKDNTFSAIMLDKDNFKFINDQLGHLDGDKALINTAYILRDSLDFTDFIARYGGDEFCIILDSNDAGTVKNAISQINNNLLDSNQCENKPYQMSFSIVYATYNFSMESKSKSFLKVIDSEKYKQKNTQRPSGKS